VVEHLTNDMDVFTVGGDGTLTPIVVNPSAGPGALSVSFAPNGVALVSETGPSGVPAGSVISSYAVAANGTLSHDRHPCPDLRSCETAGTSCPLTASSFTPPMPAPRLISGFTIASTDWDVAFCWSRIPRLGVFTPKSTPCTHRPARMGRELCGSHRCA
jgi:6-phosphogluconolactonase